MPASSTFSFLPQWAPAALYIGAAVCCVLAGLPLKPFAGPSPALPLWLVPIFSIAATLLAAFSTSLTPGTLKTVLELAVAVCLVLAGKAAPLAGQAANDNKEAAPLKRAG